MPMIDCRAPSPHVSAFAPDRMRVVEAKQPRAVSGMQR